MRHQNKLKKEHKICVLVFTLRAPGFSSTPTTLSLLTVLVKAGQGEPWENLVPLVGGTVKQFRGSGGHNFLEGIHHV